MQEPTCPSECPSARVTVTGLEFELYRLNWSGAKGTRTPGLLHAMNLFMHFRTRGDTADQAISLAHTSSDWLRQALASAILPLNLPLATTS